MKKYNYITILSLAALCFGCSDTMEEMHDARAIGFTVSGEWPDESTATRSTAFAKDDRIGVFACYRTPDGTTDGTNTAFAPNYMHNQLVSFDGTAWSYSPIKYWPSDGSVDFWGYYPYEESRKDVTDAFSHECTTGFEPLHQAKSLITAENGKLSGEGIGENGMLQLGFRPMLNKINFTAQAKDDLFEHGGEYVDCHFLIKEFRVWGFPKKAIYSMNDKKWNTVEERYTRENPLDMTAAIQKVNIEDAVPGYQYDSAAGYDTKEALVITKKRGVPGQPKTMFGKPAYFIPLEDAVEGDGPAFEVVYVVLTKPADEDVYKESGVVTRSGSLSAIFDGMGLIEKNININLFFGIDGVTVTCTLVDYHYKPMF